MVNLRIFFQKVNRAKYISHLDLNRCMQRAVKRANIPVWYTEGFNPHIYINFMLPLALGVESICEVMDMRLTEHMDFDSVKDRINAVLPQDLHIFNISEPVYKQTDIALSEYEIFVNTDLNKVKDFLCLPEIITQKKTKRGIADIDLKQYITIKEINDKNVTMCLPAGTQTNISPILVFDTYKKHMNTEISEINYKRVNVYCADGKAFC